MPATADQVRELAASLPRSYEAIVRGRVKFRIGQIVYLALSADESTMGCGFPKEFREAAVETEPEKFSLPRESDLRFNWIHVNLGAIDYDEMRELVERAWSSCVPKYVAREYAEAQGYL
ncbi:MAG: MmcQ/YjbR family DNA-binding protein [Gaiellaceae bacterium]